MINRIDWVDYAKGIGIVLVVYAHVLRGVNSAGLGLSKQFFYFSDTLVYGFHMPLFFFLSGMFSDKWVNKNTKETIIIKAKALLYPYVIWSLLQGSINIMLSSYTNKSMDWTNLIEISYKPIGQFWFLYVLFIFFMFYYFLRKIIGINKTLFVALICYILQPAFKDLWILSAILSQFIFFVAGSFFVAHKTSLPFWSDNKVMHLAFSLVFFLLINYLYIFGNYKY
ncbi:acyltransferase family protein, partial [Desulforamulus ruminis]|uniref:acyltransferase family protein n=1 Tax=Desulforamulus ruminis TaxID=1564 RepID=UPI002353F934